MKSAGAAWGAFMAGLSGDGTDGTGQDGLGEQAGGHLGEHDGAAAALVEERVQLDDVGRHHAAAVVQQLHDQVRLAVGGAAGDCGAGPGATPGSRKSTSRLTWISPL